MSTSSPFLPFRLTMGLVVVPRVAPNCLPGLVSNLSLLAAGVVGAVMVAATAAGQASAASACKAVPVHRMLSAPGGIHRLSDGREFKATVVEVGGCPSSTYLSTGMAYPDTASNYTVISALFNATLLGDGTSSSACVAETGVSAGASPQVLSGFQAVLIEANGFRFTADMVLEDIDAQALVPLSAGWREMMTSLGMAGGRVVRPAFSTLPGSFVGVQPFQIKEAALAAVGFPSSADMTVDGMAYNLQTLGRSTCAEEWGKSSVGGDGMSVGPVRLRSGGLARGRGCCLGWWVFQDNRLLFSHRTAGFSAG